MEKIIIKYGARGLFDKVSIDAIMASLELTAPIFEKYPISKKSYFYREESDENDKQQ